MMLQKLATKVNRWNRRQQLFAAAIAAVVMYLIYRHYHQKQVSGGVEAQPGQMVQLPSGQEAVIVRSLPSGQTSKRRLVRRRGPDGKIVEVDEFAVENPAFRPVAGPVVATGPVKEYDTYVDKKVMVQHHGVPTTKTEYEKVKVPVKHPAVAYKETEMKEVKTLVHPKPVQRVEYKDVKVAVPTAPFYKVVKKPYKYWVQPPPVTVTEMRPVQKVTPPVKYQTLEQRPTQVTVQPPDYVTTETKVIPVSHPAKTWYTTETVLKPVEIKVPHVTPAFTTSKVEHFQKTHHQAPITKTVMEAVPVTKVKPGSVTTVMEPFQKQVLPPKQEKVGLKEEKEVVRPPPHMVDRKEAIVVTEQPADFVETKQVAVQVEKIKPGYVTYKDETVAHQVVVPGKDYVTEELEKERVHHVLSEQQQVVAQTGPVQYLGPVDRPVGRIDAYEQDRADYAQMCQTGADCAGKPCGLQYSSQTGGYVRVCCPSGQTRREPDGRIMCVPLERRLKPSRK